MNQLTPTLKLHVINDNYGYHFNSLIIEHKNNYYNLQASTKDTIHIFTESLGIYVLTINRDNGYIGLNAYMSPEPDALNSMYLKNNQEIIEALGIHWDAMEPVAIVHKLIDCLY